MNALRDYVFLPPELGEAEARHLARANRVALAVCLLHVPVLALVALLNGTGVLAALAGGLAVSAGPALARATLPNPRHVSVVVGVATAFYGALLVHFGQGPLQIEMHFYFFAMLAALVVFANPAVILATSGTIALHHLVLWFLVPRSVFNYDAPVWVVGVHAIFVVLESIAACYSARAFFDNVLGLEKIIARRTAELDATNQELRLVLDTVRQGFATIDRDGVLSAARSRPFREWFGDARTATEAFRARSPEFAARFEEGWEQVAANLLPAAALLDQLPKDLDTGDRHLRVTCDAIGDPETAERWLLVVTDVSAEVGQERLEVERREVFQLFERALVDRNGVSAYLDEATSLVDGITRTAGDLVALKRRIHTLKGNSAIYGVDSIATLCHELETHIVNEAAPPPRHVLGELAERWTGIADNLERMIGAKKLTIELELDEYQALEREARRVSVDLFTKIQSLRLEPVRRRFEHFADQARRIGERLGKQVDVRIDDDEVRLDPGAWAAFWTAFIHAVRNAVDHGLESTLDRVRAGKSPRGTLVFRTRIEEDRLLVEIRDDGRGIAWERVRARAAAAGLPTETSADLQAALFRDGLSTADSVTDLSGRGIGMGALLDATKALGGVVTVETELGVGTLVQMSFPSSVLHDRNPDSVRRSLAA